MLSRFSLFLACAFLWGCKPVERVLNDALNSGTLRGVDKCVSLEDTTLVPREAIMRSCVRRFERPIPANDLAEMRGNGSPEMAGREAVFSGTLDNQSASRILTGATITVTFRNAGVGPISSRAVTRYRVAVDSVWLLPGRSIPFETRGVTNAPDDWTTTPYCSSVPEARCWHWEITSANGLSLQ
jgi:hypothetical protein